MRKLPLLPEAAGTNLRGNSVRVKSLRGGLTVLLVMILALVAAACGSDDDSDDAAAAGADTRTTEAGDEPEGALDELVAAAQDEGKVTIYSSQALDELNAFAAAFEDEYGIDVEVVRGIDNDLATRVETEKQTGRLTVDLYVSASQSWVETQAQQGWFVEPTMSPQLTGQSEYDAEQYVHEGNYFEVGAAILTFAWNASHYSAGLEGYEGLLDPELSGGKIGVIEPTAPSIVDFYLWLEETFGEEYVEELAAQEPRIYPSALPMGEALISGEIFAASFGAPVQLGPAKDDGAPVDFGIDENGAWGARYFGMILDGASNPNAAELLADFMVTERGQELVMGGAGTVVPTASALLSNEDVRKQDLSKLTPEAVTAYQQKWNDLFR
jgi:iron(III) transport system substrate-binding protein